MTNALQRALLGLFGLVALAIVGCAGNDMAPSDPSVVPDNPELAELHDADQGDRSGFPEIDWSVVSPRDSLRRVRVAEIVEAGGAVTSLDYYNAAMVFQHGNDTTAARLAYDLASRAVEIDTANADAKWLMAAAWDRYLMRKDEPQWYGTQYVGGPGAWRLYDIDSTKVTDAERIRLGVGTLEESRARVAEMNSPD